MLAADAKRILVISHDEVLLKTLPDLLSGAGYEPFMAPELITASTELERVHPHLVILDLGNEAANAFLLLETIRSNPDRASRQIPVLIGSKDGNLLDIGHALKLGIKDYFITMPLDSAVILKKIQKCFGEVAAAPSLPSAKVLMVEDDKFLRELATQKFVKEGFTTLSAVDGEQGVLLAEKELPDVILLDILLPGLDGFEALKRIRANSALAKVPVFMLSNFGQTEDIEKSQALGAQQFLVKANYTLDEIVAMVREALVKTAAS